MSSTLWISFLLYIERKPSEASPMTCAPCTVSSIIALTASETRGSASALVRWSSERNRKCSDITPACGDAVAGRVRLVIGEAIVLFLRVGAERNGGDGGTKQDA